MDELSTQPNVFVNFKSMIMGTILLIQYWLVKVAWWLCGIMIFVQLYYMMWFNVIIFIALNMVLFYAHYWAMKELDEYRKSKK